MDMTLFLCLAAGFIAVEALTPVRIEPRCLMYCPNGFVPGEICQCRPPTLTPCQHDECGIGERCVVRYGRAICVPKYPTYPTKPIGESLRRVCSLPQVTGPCLAAFRRYFYNSSTSRCERFIYGGCQGNENNFETLQECRRTCQHRQRRLPWF